MRPEELVALLTSREQTWELIQAIGDPALQRARGWDLDCWTYVPMAGIVFFVHHDDRWSATAAVVAVNAREEDQAAFARSMSEISVPARLVLLPA
jgi:hypothetical protein